MASYFRPYQACMVSIPKIKEDFWDRVHAQSRLTKCVNVWVSFCGREKTKTQVEIKNLASGEKMKGLVQILFVDDKKLRATLQGAVPVLSQMPDIHHGQPSGWLKRCSDTMSSTRIPPLFLPWEPVSDEFFPCSQMN